MSRQPPLFDNTSPGTAKTEYKVSGFSLGPATLAYNLSPNMTNSDRTPGLINWQSLPLADAPLVNLCELFVPHSSSATQI